jgi:anti-anti-sigma regulatory factor
MQEPRALPEELTIFTVGEWLAQCQAWHRDQTAQAGQAHVMCVDAQAVKEIDAAGLQLLLSLAHACEKSGAQFKLTTPSPVLTAACQSLGMEALLGQAHHSKELA